MIVDKRELEADAFLDIYDNEIESAKTILMIMKDDQLKRLYKASKQLSELCWQEIRRRRDE